MRRYLKNKSIQDGAAVLLLGLALGGHSVYSFFTARVKADWIMSPYLFPMLVSLFALALALCLLLEGKGQAQRTQPPPAPAQDNAPAQHKTVLPATLLSISYCVLLPILTFIPATALFLPALMGLLGEKRWKIRLPLAILVPLALYAVFALGLNVRLP